MKLYIPKHLQNIKVIDQLLKMHEEYETGIDSSGVSYKQENIDPLTKYNNYNSIDPVKRFLLNWIDRDKLKQEGMDIDSVIPYLVKRFYSLKGTRKVLDDLKRYFKLDAEIKYTTSYLEVNIKTESDYIKISDDIELFRADLYEFLNELLYFNGFTSGVSNLKINIFDKISTVVSAKFVSITNNTVEES